MTRSKQTTLKQSWGPVPRILITCLLVFTTSFGFLLQTNSNQAYAVPSSAEKQAEADGAKQRLDSWAAELNKASSDYNDALDAHDAAVAARDQAEADMLAAQAELNRLQGKLGDRASTMYKKGNLSFLEVVLGANSFAEFTTLVDLMNIVNGETATMIEQNREAKFRAQAAEAEYSAQEKLAQQKLDESIVIKAQAEETYAAYQAEVASLESEVAELLAQEQAREAAIVSAAAAAAGGGGGYVTGGWEYAGYDPGAGASISDWALSRVGCPYIWAASGPNAFDCSGLVVWCYQQVGYYGLPRGGNAQLYSAPLQLPVSAAQPGDILHMPDHVGIYIGGGAYVEAGSSATGVQIGYNMGRWDGAARWIF